MKTVLALTTALSVLAVAGCSTLEGLKSDLTSGYRSVAGTVTEIADPKEEKKKLPVYDGTCPQVTVRPDLKRIVEFNDFAAASDAAMVSQAVITNVQNVCRVENGGLLMQMDITLKGRTGPKARAKSTDKPSFAYPYFVAVTDAQGNVVSKEIFAASLAYGASQNEITQTESVFQTMPYPDASAGQTFNVIVGFQLSEEQLQYNQAHGTELSESVKTPAAQAKKAAAPKPAQKPKA